MCLSRVLNCIKKLFQRKNLASVIQEANQDDQTQYIGTTKQQNYDFSFKDDKFVSLEDNDCSPTSEILFRDRKVHQYIDHLYQDQNGVFVMKTENEPSKAKQEILQPNNSEIKANKVRSILFKITKE